MKQESKSRIGRPDWPLVLISGLILLIYLFYTLHLLFFTPYPGISFTAASTGWQINNSLIPELTVDDVLVQIGDLTFEEYQINRLEVPFAGYLPGDLVENITTADGRTIPLRMPAPTVDEQVIRMLSTLWFFPFWAAGTIVVLFLRPRDKRWQLLVAFMYLIAVWVIAGQVSAWRVGGSRLLLGSTAWLMVPVFIHLHLIVPSQLFPRVGRLIVPPLYLLAFILVVLEVFQYPPSSAPLLGNVIAIAGSFALIVTRLLRRSSPASDRIASRLMLAGIGLAFGPGLIAFILPQLLGPSAGTTLGLFISMIAVPLLPFFYTYAIYKRQLGQLEFRVSRLLSLYSFILIYPTIFIVALLFFEQWITNAAARTVYLLALSITFVLAAPPFLNRFQNFVNRLAYGTEHNPDDLLRVFAQQIPSALKREALVDLLLKEITPALLVRESALYLFEGQKATCLYGPDHSSTSNSVSPAQLRELLPKAGLYRPPSTDTNSPHSWIRLSIALITREQTIGIWLFGRRDPDDFYPKKDIDLLETLANQIAPVIENIRLYEELRTQADQLAEDVASRTVELREERDRTQAILDSAAEGIFFTDPVGRILYTNQTMDKMSGFFSGELRNRTLDLWETEDGSDETYRHIWTAIRRKQRWASEVLLRCKDGKRRDVSLSIAPIQSHSGEISGFVGIQSDISKLKEVDRLKTNIISSVSHELKTPLTTIKTYLTLLEQGAPEKQENYLVVLNKETDRLKNIIEDLLDLSALDTGQIPSKVEPVNVIALIDEIILSSRVRAAINEIDLHADLPDQLPSVLVDSHQLEQVLTNLVVNALNYTPRGGSVVLGGGPGQLDGAQAVWLSVSDDGPGISSDEMPQLFDRFYRGQAAVDSNAPGTGLGLSICKEIIARHHGKIEVDSEPGEGATFTIWLHARDLIPEIPLDSIPGLSPKPAPTQS